MLSCGDGTGPRGNGSVYISEHGAGCANISRDRRPERCRPLLAMPIRRPDSQAERAHAFGARVRSLRRAKKLTQRQVAERIPMSPGNLSRLENGEHGPPADEVIAQLAAILDIDVAELFKLAGRDVGGVSFEGQVLSELHQLRRDMRAGFDKLDAAVKVLGKQAKEP
jgi:transcriptional regulator with XRE-family HTH domain